MSGSGRYRQLIGERVGRYRVTASLGSGGMAEVFRASDDKLGREVAIKVVLPHYASEDQFLERFLREARVIASLDHPNILSVFDFGEHDGMPFLVMPLVPGGTLADRMQGDPIEPQRVVTWVRELAEALDVAHAEGVLHRDVKPGNVLVGRGERLLLGDFGIAKLFDATRLTRTGTVVGTPMYMAPEVAGGEPAAGAADRYSLAVMTYELLSGCPPFVGENVLSILHQHATCPVPPITTRVENLPDAIDGALQVGLAKDPAARPASCRAFADLLIETLPLPSPGPSSVSASRPRPSAPAVISDCAPTLALDEERASTVLTDIAEPSLGGVYEAVPRPKGVFGLPRLWPAVGLLGGLVVLVFLALRGNDPSHERLESSASRGPVSSSEEGGLASAGRGPEEPGPLTAGADATAVPEAGEALSEETLSEETLSEETLSEETLSEETLSEETPSEEVQTQERAQPGSAPPSAELRSDRSPSGGRLGQRFSAGRPGKAGRLGSRFQALRSFSARLTEGDFRQLLEVTRGLPRRSPKAAQAEAMQRYAEGGLAYLSGAEETAESALLDVLGNQRFVTSWGPSPLMLLAAEASSDRQLAGWELALGYGDARALAAAELDSLLLRQPEHPRYRFARALVHRLEGEHSAVVRDAVPVFHTFSTQDGPEARSYLALIVAEAYRGLDRGSEAVEWFRRAIEIGGSFRGVTALRAAEAAADSGQSETAADLLKLACEAKIQPACDRLKRRSGSR